LEKIYQFQEQSSTLNGWPGTSWKFVTPIAPHQNGISEAAVKAAKHHLRRVAGNTTLTFEELATVFADIEACLNSRPLSPLTDDVSDLNALTPGHFLVGEPLVTLPTADIADVPMNRLTRWKLLRRIQHDFWRRWHPEVLNQMMTATKWKTGLPNLKVGDLVILRTDNVPPAIWPLARITAVHPGVDGLVRNVTVRTAKSTYERPVQRCCLLPMAE